jgi:thiosulfate/3-mercaptopyruvate sulfurtransferase
MAISRRTLLQIASAGAFASLRSRSGFAATPAATPRGASQQLLIDASELVAADADLQRLALMPANAFEAGRIPGSLLLDWAELELADTSEAAVAAWTEEMRTLMGVRGIRADRPVVVYDEGTLFAARGWWQLAYLGYDPSRVLDGGLPAWTREGAATETGPLAIAPVEAPSIDAPVRRELLATKADVLAALDDPAVVLVDARSGDEYGKGHIPGAKNRPYAENAVMRQPSVYLSPETLKEQYAALGVSPDRRVVTYCSTGVRGSVALFSLLLAGFANVALYLGSWNEWGADPETPKETP